MRIIRRASLYRHRAKHHVRLELLIFSQQSISPFDVHSSAVARAESENRQSKIT
jgi:hypothetical protein